MLDGLSIPWNYHSLSPQIIFVRQHQFQNSETCEAEQKDKAKRYQIEK